MTTIITRLYDDPKTAEYAVTALKLQNHPDENIDVVEYGEGAKAKMIDADVPEASADAYVKKMSKGSTLVVYRAPVTPFGAARNAIDTLDEFESVDAGVENESVYISEGAPADMFLDMKVDTQHRHWATWGNERRRGLVSDAFGVPTLTAQKSKDSVMHGTRYMSRWFWPMPLVIRTEPKSKVW
jgi:hypothetical protein